MEAVKLQNFLKLEGQNLIKIFDFYCTKYQEQAERWAVRYGKIGYINKYAYVLNGNLKQLIFENMTEEWLDFVVICVEGFHTVMILQRD